MSIKGVMLDMDGVLYHGTRPIDGAAEFLAWLPVPYVFVTNNSSRTPKQVAQKLDRMGIRNTPDQILTSSLATAYYLKKNAPPQTPIYAIGEVGLFTALQDAGFVLTEDHPNYVVVGLDREFNDDKLQIAVQAIAHGATFIGTNMDRILMTEKGAFPGTGTIVERVATAANQSPLVMGKPEKQIFAMAADLLKLPLKDLLMIGDNLETDIKGAHFHNFQAAFMLTGVSTLADLGKSKLSPRFVANNLLELKSQIASTLSY